MSLSRALGLLLILFTAGAFARAQAASIARYALVIGNNHGEGGGLELPDLQHAEAEARELREALLRFGHFEPDRTVLLVGQGRAAILEAAERLAALKRQDLAAGPGLPTLFALFYSGHGVMRQLLTRDQPLSGDDLATIYQLIDATVSIGFFDACFSGSLDGAAVTGKGLVSRPGFNPLTELPQELLNTEGTLWFVSSQPNELSFEDPEIGGVLTHYFIKAFTEAPLDGAGIPLDAMWEYARRATIAHMTRRNRRQTPEKIVRHLKAKGPLIFSFPKARSATLRFAENTQGAFLLQYAQGALTERIDKPLHRSQDVAVFDGEIALIQLSGPGAGSTALATQHFDLPPGGEAVVHAPDDPAPFALLGYRAAPVRGKGSLEGLVVSEKAPALAWGLAAGYRFQRPLSDRLLFAEHLLVVNASAQRGAWIAAAGLGFGQRRVRLATWSAWINEWDVDLAAGRVLLADPIVLTLEGAVTLAPTTVAYHNGDSRTLLGGWAGGRLGAQLGLPATRPWLLLGLTLELGGRWSQGLAYTDREFYLAIEPRAGTTVQVAF